MLSLRKVNMKCLVVLKWSSELSLICTKLGLKKISLKLSLKPQLLWLNVKLKTVVTLLSLDTEISVLLLSKLNFKNKKPWDHIQWLKSLVISLLNKETVEPSLPWTEIISSMKIGKPMISLLKEMPLLMLQSPLLKCKPPMEVTPQTWEWLV
jgi:hypothetical protein